MKAKRFSEEQIIAVLKEAEAGAKTKDLCRKYGISDVTFYIYGLPPLCKRFSFRWLPGRMRTSIRRQPQSSAVAPRWVIRTRTPLQLVGPVMAYIKIRFRARRFDLLCHLSETLSQPLFVCHFGS